MTWPTGLHLKAASKFSMTSSSSSSNSPAARRWKYDVFLSFRGDDTRMNFTSHLYAALCHKALEIFADIELGRGEEIAPAILKAIEGSKVAVIIFSKGYVSSSWCLDELVKIIECHEKEGLSFFPVFYDVDPSDVRKQIGIVEKSFARHEGKENSEKVRRWKTALTRAANFAGWLLPFTGSESKLVKEIVNDILITLGRTSDGMDSTVETGSGVPKSLSIKVAHARAVEIQVPDGPGLTKSKDLPIDHLVSLLEPLQHLSEASLQSPVQGFSVRNCADICEACGDTTYELSQKCRPAASKLLMASSSCSSNSPAARRWKYDVFLSYRGADTGENFTSHLYDALWHEGIGTFMARKDVRKGEEIASAIFKAIERSKVAVIIFSKGYTSSSWCLDELAQIIEFHETKGLSVILLFYDVDPSDVRKQTRVVNESLAIHEIIYNGKFGRVNRWKAALVRAANFAGWYSQDIRPESRLVEEIVKDISTKLNQTSRNSLKDPLGMD